jgi:signal transduction histidine kinase
MGIRIATRIRGGRRTLPHSVAWAAHRILQEALTNAARHGDGDADVDIAFGADAVEIVVRNPAGPAAPAGRTGGHGLVGMRERAMLIGGTLEAGVDRAVFRLRATLPYGGTLG